jgi:O-acetyl-ADP-ribose deacetylase (regulator of RNase III)
VDPQQRIGSFAEPDERPLLESIEDCFVVIEFSKGNLLNARVEALVNAVNTVGVMGKGIALQFKRAFPENFAAYAKACMHGEVVIGRMFVTKTVRAEGPGWIVNFPTKEDWRNPSNVEYIETGLTDLIHVIERLKIRSIALPPLGCGLGGLDWAVVRPLIEATFAGLPSVRTVVFEPTDVTRTPSAKGSRSWRLWGEA